VTAAVLIGGGLLLKRLLATPRTLALAGLVRSYQHGRSAERVEAMRDVLSAFGLAGLDAPPHPAKVQRMLAAARAFDQMEGPYNWGIRVEKLLLEECVRRGWARPS
jgi:hypothetical protein